MANIQSPSDLSLGTRVKITGYDERGILIEKM